VQRGAFRGVMVIHRQRAKGLEQIAGVKAADVPQTNQADTFLRHLSFSSCCKFQYMEQYCINWN